MPPIREPPPLEPALVRSTLHDVNNMLTAISLDAEALAEFVPRAGELADGIHRTALTAAALCRRLLVHSGAAPLHAIDLGSMLDDILRHTPELDVTLCLDAPPPLSVDGLRLRQAIANLVSNAMCAMRRRVAKLTIEAAHVARSEPGVDALGATLRPGCYWVLSVADCGAGLTAEQLGQIFDEGYSTRRDAVVSGFGLSAVSEAMAWHGGSVIVDSVVGQGSRFALWFPTM